MIPKVINVIWVGGGDLPEKEARCIGLTRERLVGYEFRLWGDDDVPFIVDRYPLLQRFVEYAYENKKWAFLSDMVKMYILVEFGGWVMDADNEFVCPPSAYERHHWVSGFENWKGLVHPITAIMGAVPQHSFSRLLLSAYVSNDPNRLCEVPNTRWISHLLEKNGCRKDDTRQYIDALDVQVYPHSVFCATTKMPETVAFHHFSGSWLPNEAR